MGTYENPAASTNDVRRLSLSKLMEIDGIAEKTAAAMVEVDIHSYADLTRYLSQHTAQEVSAALKEHGVNRPPAFIDKEAWIRQAELFSQLENTTSTLPEGETEPAENPEKASSSRESPEHDVMFTVIFDVVNGEDGEPVLHTTVHDGGNAGREEVFQGSDTAPWVNWILERANLPFAKEHRATQVEVTGEPPPTEAVVPSIPTGLTNAGLEIDEVQLSVIGPTSEYPERRLKAEINFQLSGAGAEALTSQGIHFRIESYTVDLESSVSELAVSGRSQLKPHVFKYRVQQEFAIPDVGRYGFYSLVLLLPPGDMAAYHKGPTLKVIP